MWIYKEDKKPKLIYHLPSLWKITSLSYDKFSNNIFFTEVHSSDYWVYSNVRSIQIDKTFIIETIASYAGHEKGGCIYGRHYFSPNSGLVAIQMKCYEYPSFEIYKKTDTYWTKFRISPRVYKKFIGWSEDANKVYLGSSIGMIGMFMLDLDSLKQEKIYNNNVISMSPNNNIFLTAPYSFGFKKPYPINLVENESFKVINTINHTFKGSPIIDQIKWHPSKTAVLLPERTVFAFEIKQTYITVISTIDSLNKSTTLPEKITNFEWSKFDNSFLYSLKGDLYHYTFEYSSSKEISLFNDSKYIQKFIIIWKN